MDVAKAHGIQLAGEASSAVGDEAKRDFGPRSDSKVGLHAAESPRTTEEASSKESTFSKTSHSIPQTTIRRIWSATTVLPPGVRKTWARGIGGRTALASGVALVLAYSRFGRRFLIYQFLSGIMAMVAVDESLGETLIQVKALCIAVTAATPLCYPAWLWRLARSGGGFTEIRRDSGWEYGKQSLGFNPWETILFLSIIFIEIFAIVEVCGWLGTPSYKFAVLGAVLTALDGTPPPIMWINLIAPLVVSIAVTIDAHSTQRYKLKLEDADQRIRRALEASINAFRNPAGWNARFLAEARADILVAELEIADARKLVSACRLEMSILSRCMQVHLPPIDGLVMAVDRVKHALSYASELNDSALAQEEDAKHSLVVWLHFSKNLNASLETLTCIASWSQYQSVASDFARNFAVVRSDLLSDAECRSTFVSSNRNLRTVYGFLFDALLVAVYLIPSTATRSKRDFVMVDDESRQASLYVAMAALRKSEEHTDMVHDEKTTKLLQNSPDAPWWHEPFRFSTAVTFGCALALPSFATKLNVWVPLTMCFVHARRTSSAFATAKLRIDGTTTGAIFGLLLVSWVNGLHIERGVLRRNVEIILLVPWIAAQASVRKLSRGYGGWVASITPLVILGSPNAEESFVLRIKATIVGAVLYLAIAQTVFPRRAEALLKPKLALLCRQINGAFGSVVFRSCQGDCGADTEVAAGALLKAAKATLREVSALVALAKDEPTLNGLYPSFDFLSHSTLVAELDSVLHQLGIAKCCLNVARTAAADRISPDNLEALRFLRDYVDTSVSDALCSASTLLDPKSKWKGQQNRDDQEEILSTRPSLVYKAPSSRDHRQHYEDDDYVPLALLLARQSRHFTALNRRDMARLLAVDLHHQKSTSNAILNADSAKVHILPVSTALAYFSFVSSIDATVRHLASTVAALENIVGNHAFCRHYTASSQQDSMYHLYHHVHHHHHHHHNDL